MHTPSSKHEAVQMMLSCLGIAPQSDLSPSDSPSDGPANSEELLAEKILDDALADVQSQGWAFNREEGFPLNSQEDGRILLPPSLLKIERVYHHPHLRERTLKQGKSLARYLYDTKHHTFLIKQTVTADVVWRFAFEEVPEAYRRYVIVRAARIFQDRVLGSSTLHAFSERDELMALSGLKNADNELHNPNFLSGNLYFQDLLER